MAAFLKVVSGVYLVVVWLTFAGVISTPTPLTGPLGSDAMVKIFAFMIAIGLSIPAVALFAFGQVVGDVRIMRNNARLQSEHLQAMRAYYEPMAGQR
jgi:hypothetical protein